MIVDLTEKDEKGSFELKGGGKVHLRLMDDKDVREINAACFKTKAEYPLLKDPVDGKEKYQRFEGREVDSGLLIEMRLDRNITGWDDVFDRNNKPIPVTKENKVLLYRLVADFREAVDNGLKALKETGDARTEQAEKN